MQLFTNSGENKVGVLAPRRIVTIVGDNSCSMNDELSDVLMRHLESKSDLVLVTGYSLFDRQLQAWLARKKFTFIVLYDDKENRLINPGALGSIFVTDCVESMASSSDVGIFIERKMGTYQVEVLSSVLSEREK